MADTFTSNFGLTKPEPGASADTWGAKINADLDTIDSVLVAARSSFLPCALATTGNITLAGEQGIDGTLTSGTRVLVWKQTNPVENGLYLSAAGAWARTQDANETAEFVTGRDVLVTGGNTNGGRRLYISSPVVSLGVSSVVFSDAVRVSDVSATGNASIGGTLAVTGASTLAAVSATTVTASGAISAASVTAGGGSLAQATTSVRGTITVATTAESQAFASDIDSITPLRLKEALQGANQLLNQNGYQKLPGGLILQWGRFSAAANASTVQSFPIAFPNNCFAAVVSGGAPLGDQNGNWPATTSVTASQLTVFNYNDDAQTAHFIAVGN